MKTYRFTDIAALAATVPELHAEAVARGRFSRNRVFIELPEDLMMDAWAEPVHGLRLGDAVAAVAQPVARLVDAVAGTRLATCGGCQERKDALNRIGMPEK